ncbi:unnamed protein product [Prunus armeniaca]
MGLRFLLDLGCPTYVNAGLLFTLLHITNLTSLLSSFREILKNLYCLSKRGVVVHPKWAAAVVGQVHADGPAVAYHCRSGLEHAGPRALQASLAKWLAKDASPLRKKPRIPYAEKTQVRAISSSYARVKHLVGADSRKVGGMRGVWGALPEPHADKLENHDSLPGIARALSRSAELVKRGVDSASLTSLKVRMAVAKKTREPSPWAKGSPATLAVDPKVEKSSPAGDAGVSDLPKTNFLSSLSAYFKLVDHIHQAGDLETVSNAYLRLKCKNADISFSYDKLLARFGAYNKSAEKSKFEVTMNAYKLGYLNCSNGTDPFYAIGDGDIKMLCSDLLPMNSE